MTTVVFPNCPCCCGSSSSSGSNTSSSSQPPPPGSGSSSSSSTGYCPSEQTCPYIDFTGLSVTVGGSCTTPEASLGRVYTDGINPFSGDYEGSFFVPSGKRVNFTITTDSPVTLTFVSPSDCGGGTPGAVYDKDDEVDCILGTYTLTSSTGAGNSWPATLEVKNSAFEAGFTSSITSVTATWPGGCSTVLGFPTSASLSLVGGTESWDGIYLSNARWDATLMGGLWGASITMACGLFTGGSFYDPFTGDACGFGDLPSVAPLMESGVTGQIIAFPAVCPFDGSCDPTVITVTF